MRQIRVLEVLASGALEGESTHVAALAAGLDPERFEVHLACSAEGPMAGSLARAGLTAHLLTMRGWLNLGAFWQLRRIMREAHIELVHLHGSRAALAGLVAARVSGAACVYTVHGWEWTRRGDPVSSHLIRAIERTVAHAADAVVCVSQEDLVAGIRLGLVNPTRARVIPSGVERDGHRTSRRRGDQYDMIAAVAALYEALTAPRPVRTPGTR